MNLVIMLQVKEVNPTAQVDEYTLLVEWSGVECLCSCKYMQEV